MSEIELFTYIVMTVSAVGATVLLWKYVKRLERDVLEERSARVGVHEASVILDRGFRPDTVVVKVGQRVRLNFRRQEAADCGELMIPAFGQRVNLPFNETVIVEVTPDKPGEYDFTCEATTATGRIIVKPS